MFLQNSEEIFVLIRLDLILPSRRFHGHSQRGSRGAITVETDNILHVLLYINTFVAYLDTISVFVVYFVLTKNMTSLKKSPSPWKESWLRSWKTPHPTLLTSPKCPSPNCPNIRYKVR